VIGTEVDRNGNTLTVWSDGVAHPLNVAEACSGMRMLVAFLALGVFLAYTNLKGWWQRSLLVLCGVPIAILVNMIRIASMGILTQYDQNFVDGEFHELVGVLWMLPALFLYMGTLWVVRNLIVDETEVKHAV
jgi:exosortase